MFELIDLFVAVRPTSPHDNEIIVLSRANAALEEAAAATNADVAAGTSYWLQACLCNAVVGNTRLWIAFRHDLLNDDNRLSEGLKTALDRLARLAIRHGSRVLAGKASPQLLIDINCAVIAGLDCSRRRLRPRADAVPLTNTLP